MVKPFRFLLIRISSGIKIAECAECHAVHVFIHCFHIIRQHSSNKIIIICVSLRKPVLNHVLEHPLYFQICQRELILWHWPL